MQELPQERLTVGIGALASAEAALQWTLDYTRERKRRSASRWRTSRNTRFKLAEMATEIRSAGSSSIAAWSCISRATYPPPPCASTGRRTCNGTGARRMRPVARRLRVMWEYPVARAWADARVQRIYAGTARS
ncbi:acyl-CoA dehydrogenase family protein [Pseudomonas aeruginosa]|nr:acyl-CoA dehydrogenase family protein [Pseudomonas aeruginosa]